MCACDCTIICTRQYVCLTINDLFDKTFSLDSVHFVVDARLSWMSKAGDIFLIVFEKHAFEGMVSAACSDVSRMFQTRD